MKITLTYKDVPYTLEYDRNSITLLENNNFSVEEFIKKPMVNIELAFRGAFIKNHRKIKQDLVDEIYANCKNKQALINALVEMIQETYEVLFDEPDDNEGNAEWEVVGSSSKKKNK